VHSPSLFAALDLYAEALGECKRSSCRDPAATFVLRAAAYWECATASPEHAIQQYCERHIPSTVPFHTNHEVGEPRTPGFGWTPGRR